MKITLEIEEEFDFSLFGISCHAKDYRLSWEINKSLRLSLKKEDHVYPASLSKNVGFSKSSYFDEKSRIQYTLISNIQDGINLIPEQSQLDYFLKVNGPQHEDELLHRKQILQNIDLVLTVVQVDPKKLKSRINLVF